MVHVSHGIAPLSRPEAAGEGRAGRRAPGAGIPGRHEALRAQRRRSAWCRSTWAGRRAGRRWPGWAGGSGAGRSRPSQEAVGDLAAEMLELQAARASRPGIAFPPGYRVAAGVRRLVPLPRDRRPTGRASRPSSATCRQPGPWIACSAATWASARPSWRCGRRSRRWTPATRWRCWCPPRSWPSSTCGPFPRRMAEFPFEIAVALAASPRGPQQSEIIRRLEAGGSIDIVIGTHRLVQPDVRFQNLGLVDHRRGAAVRRGGQGAAEGPAADRRRADDDRHAHPADAAHVAAGAARHLQPGNAARPTAWPSKPAWRGSTPS